MTEFSNIDAKQYNSLKPYDTLNEIESCLNLATKISRNIDRLQDSLLWLKTQFVALVFSIFITAGLLSFIVYDIRLGSEASKYFVISAVLGITWMVSYFVVLHFPRYVKTNDDLQVEISLITSLITMISSLQKTLGEDVSPVTKTLIEMRLSKIRFFPK